MSFIPYSLQITSDTRSLYSHDFVQFNVNDYLLGGMIAALRMLYEEIFDDTLDTIGLGKFDIVIQEVGNIELIILYQGEVAHARMFLTEFLDTLCQGGMVDEFEEISLNSSITLKQIDYMNSLVAQLPSFNEGSSPVGV